MRALTAQEPVSGKEDNGNDHYMTWFQPQGCGTKMLIYRDGRCVGTIGGGCMEARVIQIARTSWQQERENKGKDPPCRHDRK